MRFVRVVKGLPRSVVMAVLFGGLVGLTASKGSAYQPQPEQNQYCPNADNQNKCSTVNLTGVRWCPPNGGTCSSTQTAAFSTCTPTEPITCTNDDTLYGHTLCVGNCNDDNNSLCRMTIYHCR